MEINVAFKKVDTEYLEANYNAILQGLYASRQEKVKRFRNKKAAYTSMTAGLLFQEIVADRFGLKPQDIIIGVLENAKPYLKEYPEFKYNLSHSGNMAVMAYSSQEIGVDIEEIRDKNINVAERCFCPSEYEYVKNGKSDYEISRRFFEIWTMKEAYLKYTGEGISVPLNSFEVDVENKCVKGRDLKYYTGEIDGYIYSVCAKDVSELKLDGT